MPIEVSEITVRIAVRDPKGEPQVADAGRHAVLTSIQRSEIVDETVRVVLRTLRLMGAR